MGRLLFLAGNFLPWVFLLVLLLLLLLLLRVESLLDVKESAPLQEA